MTGTISIDEFREKVGNTRPKCQVCGHRAHSLAAHLLEAHKMTVGQYKEKFGKSITVISPIVTEFLRGIERSAKPTDKIEDIAVAFFKDKAVDIFADAKTKLWPVKTENAAMIPQIVDEFFFDMKVVPSLVYAIQRQNNAFVEGPTGCGKTDGVEQIHAQLGLPCKRVNMNGDVTVGNFIGTKEADPAKGTYFRFGNLPRAMMGGYTLVIDEIDYCPPAIAAVLNPVLEGKRVLYIPETDQTIHAEQGFNVIGTGNTGGKGDDTGVYTGTEVMNTALLDRFPVKLTQGYLPLKDEITMLAGRFPTMDSGLIQRYVQAAADIRQSFMSGNLPVTVSTRKLIDILRMEPLLGKEAAFANTILNWLNTDNREVVSKMLDNRGIKLDRTKL